MINFKRFLFAVIASLFCVCTNTPDHCGDNVSYDPKTQFCHADDAYDKCGGKEYDPAAQKCSNDGKIEERCVDGKYAISKEPCGVPAAFTVEFDTDGGVPEVISPVTVDSGKTAGTEFPEDPAKEHHTFDGWFDDEDELYDSSTVITKNATLRAKWTVIEYTLTVDIDPEEGGVISREPDTAVYASGTEVTVTAEPKKGYTFVGWLGASESTKDTVTIIMNDDKELTAKFQKKKYAVEFDTDGGIPSIISPVTVDSGKTAGTEFPEEPTKEHHTFDGWFCDEGEPYDSSTVITKNVTLKAKWTIVNYTLTINMNHKTGGTITIPAQGQGEYSHPAGTVIPISTVANSKYVFTGWTLTGTPAAIDNESNANAQITLNSDATVTANFVRQYTVMYNTNGGSGVGPNSQTVNDGDHVKLAGGNGFSRDGYTFVKWNTSADGTGADYDVGASFTPTSDTTLYARWGFMLTIKRNPDGNAGTIRFIDYDEDYTKPVPFVGGTEIAIRAVANSGHTFRKWTVDSGEATFGSADVNITNITLNSDATITANFYGSVKDKDGRNYRTTKIGNLTWMAENLNYDMDIDSSSLCYNGSPDSCAKYGRLYTWETANSVCSSLVSEPNSGWRLPTNNDWNNLIDYAVDNAGTKLKSSTVGTWYPANDTYYDLYYKNTDYFGFSALPGGYRFGYGGPSGSSIQSIYSGEFGKGFWWSATESESNTSNALYASMYYGDSYVEMSSASKNYWHSVRCVR